MKNIKEIRTGGKFRDEILNGFLGILNFKYNDKMDYANTFFLPKVKELNFDADYIKLVMRSRLRNKSIFDLNDYFVLNHIGDDHWGIIHILPKEKSIICFDGYHYKQQEEYEIVSRSLNILSESLSITEFQNCQWHKKDIASNLFPKQEDGWNCGTFVALYAYHMTVNGYLPKATENTEYLEFFRLFMVSCFYETKHKNEPILSLLE